VKLTQRRRLTEPTPIPFSESDTCPIGSGGLRTSANLGVYIPSPIYLVFYEWARLSSAVPVTGPRSSTCSSCWSVDGWT
jgi:hypothetical protein